MFPLAGKSFPTSTDELAVAIATALGDIFTLKDGNAVNLTGGKFPTIKTVTIDLDGSTISANKPPPKPLGTGKRAPGPRVDTLSLSAQPIQYEQAKLNLKLTATGLKFDFDRDKHGNPLLVLTAAKDGKVDASISKDDIEALLSEVVTFAAKQHGIKIEDLELDLQKAGPRAIAAAVRVTARKMMVSGAIRITSELAIDEELNATISNLDCQGEGIIGSAAAAVVRAKIAHYNGQTIPLMPFSLGDVSLRDLKIELTRDLHVSAAFGSA